MPPEQPRMLRDLIRVETRLYNLTESALKAAGGISLGQWLFLDALDRLGPSRVQDLVADIDITIGATSKAVDRMAAAGLLRRSPHPTDRRSQLVSPTASGRRHFAEASTTIDEVTNEAFAGLSADARRDLAASLRALSRALEPEGPSTPRVPGASQL